MDRFTEDSPADLARAAASQRARRDDERAFALDPETVLTALALARVEKAMEVNRG